MNSVLNAPLPHPQIPQGHEGEAPGLLPSLAIAENDSYQEEKQKLLTGERPEARRSELTVGLQFLVDPALLEGSSNPSFPSSSPF